MFTILERMATEFDEAVTVGAVFSPGSIRPVWFTRQGRQVRIRELALTWKTREGSTYIFHFSVSDGQGVYELTYNTGTHAWRLAASA